MTLKRFPTKNLAFKAALGAGKGEERTFSSDTNTLVHVDWPIFRRDASDPNLRPIFSSHRWTRSVRRFKGGGDMEKGEEPISTNLKKMIIHKDCLTLEDGDFEFEFNEHYVINFNFLLIFLHIYLPSPSPSSSNNSRVKEGKVQQTIKKNHFSSFPTGWTRIRP